MGNKMKLIMGGLIIIFTVWFGLSSISYYTSDNPFRCIDGYVHILQNDYYVKRTINGKPQECILEENHQDKVAD